MNQHNHASKEPTRQSLRGADVDAWLYNSAPQSTYLQQAQPQTQPAKPRTQWIFEVVFEKRDLILAAAVVAIAYAAARS